MFAPLYAILEQYVMMEINALILILYVDWFNVKLEELALIAIVNIMVDITLGL